jgi:hypothetical protein
MVAHFGRIAINHSTKIMTFELLEAVVREEGGCITQATRSEAGGLTVFATFLAEGPLRYTRADGASEEEFLPWESISDAKSLATAPGSFILYGHPSRANKEVKADEWGKYGKGMAALPIYLHRPFAVIACHIGDKDLALSLIHI